MFALFVDVKVSSNKIRCDVHCCSLFEMVNNQWYYTLTICTNGNSVHK